MTARPGSEPVEAQMDDRVVLAQGDFVRSRLDEAADYRQVAESVMRECIINLARIKETVGQSIESRAPSQGLDSVPSLIRRMKAGLMRFNKTRAMAIVARIRRLCGLIVHGAVASRPSPTALHLKTAALLALVYYGYPAHV